MTIYLPTFRFYSPQNKLFVPPGLWPLTKSCQPAHIHPRTCKANKANNPLQATCIIVTTSSHQDNMRPFAPAKTGCC